MIDICVSKLTSHNHDEQKKALITQLGDQLKKAISPLDKDAVNLLVSNWKNSTSVHALYTLMILRLAVLHPPTNNSDIIYSIAAALSNDNAEGTKDRSNIAHGAPVRSMAWCVLSNVFGSTRTRTKSTVEDNAALEKLVDAALLDIVPERQPRVEVRRSASAFLYNLITVDGGVGIGGCKVDRGVDEISDVVVTLLCGVTEGLNEDPDLTTKIRRSLVVGKILCPILDEGIERGNGVGLNETAVRLVNNLGFADIFVAMSREAGDSSDDGKQLLVLVNEILSVLRSI